MKRKTKEQRESEEKAALKRRLLDMLRGAHGGYQAILDGDVDDEVETPSTLGLETFARWLGAIQQTWMLPRDADCNIPGLREWDMQPTVLHKFSTVDSAAEYLHYRGARA